MKIPQVIHMENRHIGSRRFWLCTLACGHFRTIPVSEPKPTKLKCPQCSIKP